MPDRRLVYGAAAVLAAAAAWTAWRMSGNSDMAAPPRQVAAEDDLASFTSHTADGRPGVICERADHHAGYVYTVHRYPRACGGEITAVIHRGFSPMRIPAGTPDAQWIAAPPSEAMF